jgi:cytochrome c556
MISALATVHTTGINWAPVFVQVIAFAGVVLGSATFITNRIDKNREKTKSEIESSVSNVSAILKGQLDNISEKVTKVETHLETQDKRLIRHGEDIAAMKGALRARPSN